MTWPEALIPPVSVTVGTSTVNWHPCLLLEVSPHDGPAIDTSVTAVRGSNNLAQRNIAIDDLVPDSGLDGSWFGMVAGSFDPGGVASLVIDGSQLKGTHRVRLGLVDPRRMRPFAESAMRAADPPPGAGGDEPILWPDSGAVHVPARTMRDPLGAGCCGFLMRIGLGGLFGSMCRRPPTISVGGIRLGHARRDRRPPRQCGIAVVPAGRRARPGTGLDGRRHERGIAAEPARGDGETSAGYSIVR